MFGLCVSSSGNVLEKNQLLAISRWELYHAEIEGSSSHNLSFSERMAQLLTTGMFRAINGGYVAGTWTVTHDIRDPDHPVLTMKEETNIVAPILGGFEETFAIDPSLQQFKYMMHGRGRMRIGYAWNKDDASASGGGPSTEPPTPSPTEESSVGLGVGGLDDVVGGDRVDLDGNDHFDAELKYRMGEDGDGDGGGDGSILEDTFSADAVEREQPLFPSYRSASEFWDEAGKNGRPSGFLVECPFSTDSLLLGSCVFGDEFKYGPGSADEQYFKIEAAIFKAWKGAFPDFNTPFAPSDCPSAAETGSRGLGFPPWGRAQTRGTERTGRGEDRGGGDAKAGEGRICIFFFGLGNFFSEVVVVVVGRCAAGGRAVAVALRAGCCRSGCWC